jgi:hypothetical protein
MTNYEASPEVAKSNLLIVRHMLMNRAKTQAAPMGQYGQRPGLAPTVPDYGSLANGAEQKFNAAQNSASSNIPTVGTIQKGYKFKGGDPSNPSSWEKVQ